MQYPCGAANFATGVCMESRLARYFFNVKDGRTEIDREGMELPDVHAARSCALQLAGSLLAEGGGVNIWDGEPFVLWVSDAPYPGGKKLFTVRVSSETPHD